MLLPNSPKGPNTPAVNLEGLNNSFGNAVAGFDGNSTMRAGSSSFKF